MKLAIIGGTGALGLFESEEVQARTTPFGPPSARPERIRVGDRELWFLARHGRPHRIPPHRVNYRANLHVLKSLGTEGIIAVNAVGGIDPDLEPGDLVVTDQLIDYTWGRAHTFSEGGSAPLQHVEFTQPFAGRVREALIAGAEAAGVAVVPTGCYGATQGPRLETAAEIRRLAAEGCTVVGMTGMPEAALARELGLDYAGMCVVVNKAAGLDSDSISMAEIQRVLEEAVAPIRSVIEGTVDQLAGS